jgi:hypothetical protein
MLFKLRDDEDLGIKRETISHYFHEGEPVDVNKFEEEGFDF